jgi:peptidyl-prolyl cis-trans isomerase C
MRQFSSALSSVLALLLGITSPLMAQDNVSDVVAVTGPQTLAQPSAEDVVVTVNGTEITHGKIMQLVQRTMMQLSQRVPPQQLQQMAERIYEDSRERSIADLLLRQAASEQGVTIADADVDAQVEQASAGLPEEMTLEDALSRQNMTLDSFKSELRQNMQIEKLLDQLVMDVPEATEEEVNAFYNDNPDQFRTPGSVTASHILFSFEDGDTDEQKAEKKAKLEKIHQELVDGADFATLAKEHSGCPSGQQGGNLGTFSRGQMVPPFEEAAFSMEQGDLSNVVETRFGYHLIKVTGKQEEGMQNLEEVRPQLTDFLSNQKKQDKVMEYIAGLRENADIVMTDMPSAP